MKVIMKEKEERALEQGAHSLHKSVSESGSVILRAQPDIDGETEGEFTLITPGTVSINGEDLETVASGWFDINEPEKDIDDMMTHSKIAWSTHKRIDGFVESLISQYGEDTTANDFIIEKRV